MKATALPEAVVRTFARVRTSLDRLAKKFNNSAPDWTGEYTALLAKRLPSRFFLPLGLGGRCAKFWNVPAQLYRRHSHIVSRRRLFFETPTKRGAEPTQMT